MSVKDYEYDLQRVMSLNHLADTVLTISEMRGEKIENKQYYINTTYRLPESRRENERDVGIRMTKGFSIQKSDIPRLIEVLSDISKGVEPSHYFVCYSCTSEEGRMVLHQKKSASEPARCTKASEANSDAFVVR